MIKKILLFVIFLVFAIGIVSGKISVLTGVKDKPDANLVQVSGFTNINRGIKFVLPNDEWTQDSTIVDGEKPLIGHFYNKQRELVLWLGHGNKQENEKTFENFVKNSVDVIKFLPQYANISQSKIKINQIDVFVHSFSYKDEQNKTTQKITYYYYPKNRPSVTFLSFVKFDKITETDMIEIEKIAQSFNILSK